VDSLRSKAMLAARYLAPHQLQTVEVPMPMLDSNEVLIQVDACGFCGSDIGIISGLHPRAKAPLTIGHEFCGRVVSLGDNHAPGLAIDDFVTAYPLLSCGHCGPCSSHMPHVCRNLRLYGFDRDGGMAEYVKVARPNVVKLPATIPPQVAALIEPLAVAVHGVRRVPASDLNTALVIGAGPIGLLTALVAKLRGVARVIVSDINPSRLALARHLGFEAFHSGKEIQEAIADSTRHEGVDCVFECAGSVGSAEQMTMLVRTRGTIVNLGVFKKPVPLDMQSVNFKELEILGSRVYTHDDFLDAAGLTQQLPLQSIVTHVYKLAEAQDAFAHFARGADVCKVLLQPNSC
jgi:(R,R)-butanediol dehydrogenase / meso-butanediol dehydrogenase / diacetyl reductase